MNYIHYKSQFKSNENKSLNIYLKNSINLSKNKNM